MSETQFYYSETKEKAGEFLRLSLGMMAQYHISVTPVNYAVWYEYISGANTPLKKVMDSLIKKKIEFTPELLQKVFIQYVNGGIDGVTNHSIMTAVQRVVEMVSEHVGEASKSEKSLKSCAGMLEKEMDVKDVRSIVDVIIKETKSVIASGEYLETSISAANKEIGALRKKLEKSETEAQTDTLTGLRNRRGMETIFAKEMEVATATGKKLCVMMADIDFFKKVNDNFGHLVGDNVLKIFASTLKSFVKGKDMVVRYGGEEFLIILPETPLEGARILAEKIRSFLETKEWQRKGSGKSLGKITISLGISQYKDGESPEDFIQRADKALYASKENGRNRVTTEEQL